MIFAKTNMMKKSAALLLILAMAFVLPSCFLFKKTQGPRLPAPPKKVEQQEPEPQKEEQKENPYDVPAFGEKTKKPVYNVALFVPLAVDKVVSDSGFQVGSSHPLPSATLQGLGFYEGALMALDSLRKQQIDIRMHVYDSRSSSQPLSRLLSSGRVDSADLLIGAVNGEAFKALANFSKDRQINFVSATYPNDGGLTNNPFLVIVNSTLRIHCTAIQSFAQQKFNNQKITVVYYDNPQGQRNLEYLQQAYQKQSGRKTPLHPFEWTNDTAADKLLAKLDKSKTNVIVLTTLYPDVSLNIIGQLAPYAADYNIQIVGMPTLSGLSELKQSTYKGITLYYSSVFPYENLAQYPAMTAMMWRYFNQYHARPSNEALNGYETFYYFGQLLHKKGRHFNASIRNPSGNIMTDFSFQPVYDSDQADPPDYFENTRIYFLRERDGKVTPAN